MGKTATPSGCHNVHFSFFSSAGLLERNAKAAHCPTESFISQLLTRKKARLRPARTDSYDRMGDFLRIPAEKLSRLADIQRKQELKKRVAGPPRPLFQESRDFVLRKCSVERQTEVRRVEYDIGRGKSTRPVLAPSRQLDRKSLLAAAPQMPSLTLKTTC